MDKDVEDRIRTRAYLIWMEEGQPHGRDAEHWARAEAEVAATGGAKPKRTGTRRASPKTATAEAKPAAAPKARKPRASTAKADAGAGTKTADGTEKAAPKRTATRRKKTDPA